MFHLLFMLTEKMNTCHRSPKKSAATKINKHMPFSYSLFTHCSFDTTKRSLVIREVKIV